MNLISIYLVVCDGGDGSASVRFFKDKTKVDWLLENNEDYYMNEGRATELQVPFDTVIDYSDDKDWLFEVHDNA